MKPEDPSKGSIPITCGQAAHVCTQAPSYDTFAPKFGPGGNPKLRLFGSSGGP